MKYLCAALILASSIQAHAKMSAGEFITEMEALATTIALEEKCGVVIDQQKITDFIPIHFSGMESELIADMDTYVRLATRHHKDISDLQLNLVCASIKSYIAKHDLEPGT